VGILDDFIEPGAQYAAETSRILPVHEQLANAKKLQSFRGVPVQGAGPGRQQYVLAACVAPI
jgi:hypothetical protein